MTHVTPYDRFALRAEEMERLLASGQHARDLIAYFGAEEYAELAALARSAQGRRGRRGERVYVIPGIMGSQLGLARAAPLPVDVVWLDPIDISTGGLLALQLTPDSRIEPLEAMLYNYLRLKLELERAGFDPVLHRYDWRRSVGELGEELAARVRADRAGSVRLVTHSMGGLLARAAMRLPGMEKVTSLVMLGTPNFGSFAPVQALRGVYPLVRRIAALDLHHTAEELAAHVFTGFASLYELLPARATTGTADLFDPASWPDGDPRPQPGLLAAARGLAARLAAADPRMSSIVGIGQDTVTGAALEAGEFLYSVTRDGDGTVPAALATLPGACNYFTPTIHGELPRSRAVTAAVIEILDRGATGLLATEWSPARAPLVQVSESQLRRTHLRKVDWAALSPEERRLYLEHLNDPPHFARTSCT